MRVEKILCDRAECKGENCKTFRIFKDRKPDGAGSSENWYYTFDLCAACAALLLDFILEAGPDKTYIYLVDNLKIKWRVE